jgi:hypothetical protein
MSKFEMTKTIEARKLNKRTRVPTSEAPVTIPFGAIIEDRTEEGDLVKFTYLGEPYQCLAEVFNVASAPIQPLKLKREPIVGDAPAAELAFERRLEWGEVRSSHGQVLRAKVPGGWLVLWNSSGGALAFYPDPEHRWDGASLL